MHVEDYTSSDDDGRDEAYFGAYADLSVHRLMLQDVERRRFYRESLTSERGAVRDKIVVDVGAGSGVLSIWAARQSAVLTIAVEASQLADVLPQVFAENGVQDTTVLFHGTVEALTSGGVEKFLADFPHVRQHGGVDVIVSEWMGFYLLHECMLPSVVRARDFFTAVNASLGRSGAAITPRMIPDQAVMYAAPLCTELLYRDSWKASWAATESANDLRLDTLARLDFSTHFAGGNPYIELVPASALLHEPVAFLTLDLTTITVEEAHACGGTARFEYSTSPAFAAAQADMGDRSSLHGFVLWFEVRDCTSGSVLTTGPLAPPTHWKQTLVLMPDSVAVPSGIFLSAIADEVMLVDFQLTCRNAASRQYTIDVQLRGDDDDDKADDSA